MTEQEILIRCASTASLWNWLTLWIQCRVIKAYTWMINKCDALSKWGRA